MLHKNRIICTALLAMALLLAACSPSAEKLNGEGNQAFLEQAYQDALTAYQGAQIENPELAEPYYNAANALYREGNYEAALEQLQHALSFAGDDQLVENSLYNIGNNFFNAQDLQNAIEAYKQALLINPEDQEAKYNLELALQQQEQEQEQNQEEQQNQDGSEGNDTSDEQSEDSQNSGDPTEEEEGEQDQSSDQAGEAEEQDEQQNGEPQPGEDNQNQEGNTDGQNSQPIERMSEEQAKQMLAAIANDMETLQEKLGKILFVRGLPPLQDW
jgi:Ca-activated chloride channel family protein